jgi:hypothetical protein
MRGDEQGAGEENPVTLDVAAHGGVDRQQGDAGEQVDHPAEPEQTLGGGEGDEEGDGHAGGGKEGEDGKGLKAALGEEEDEGDDEEAGGKGQQEESPWGAPVEGEGQAAEGEEEGGYGACGRAEHPHEDGEGVAAVHEGKEGGEGQGNAEGEGDPPLPDVRDGSHGEPSTGHPGARAVGVEEDPLEEEA